MTESAFAAFFGAIGENIDFLAFAVFNDFCDNFCAFNIGSTYFEGFAAKNKNLIKGNFFAFVDFEFSLFSIKVSLDFCSLIKSFILHSPFF